MGINYRNSALRQLKEQQARFAPPEEVRQLLQRAEGLLEEIEDRRSYPYEYLWFRIKGYRPETAPNLVLDGRDVRHDLRAFIEDLSGDLKEPVEGCPEPVLTVEALSRKFSVSTRTINRWRRQGLVARRFVIDGRTKVGFLESSVNRFVAGHRDQVDRGSRFHHLTDEERDEIIGRARRLAAVPGASPTEIARRVARNMNRAPETIRLIIKGYDKEHPDRAIFPKAGGPLDEDQKGQIYRLHRRGYSAEALARQFRRTRSSIYRLINEQRARRLLEVKLDRIPHPTFDDPALASEILGPAPRPIDLRAPRKAKAPKGLPPYLASLYEVPLLSREEELHLFRKMNYLKHQAIKLREGLDPTHTKATDLDEIERLQDEALAIKNQLIRANLRLVVSIAKRHMGPSNNFFELISDGNMSLIRAVEKFDFSRGNKFSTYASWAIMKNFARTIPEETYRRDRFVTGHDEMFDTAADNRTDEHEYESAQKRLQEVVKGMLGKLDERERRIIISRYGINGASEQTLEQLGKDLGITKERVRQIESRAQEKLRCFAREEKLELTIP